MNTEPEAVMLSELFPISIASAVEGQFILPLNVTKKSIQQVET